VLIPSIDLMGGRIVQLRQGAQLALETPDVDLWIRRFTGFPVVQLIDLDAAMGRPPNDALVRRITEALPCQVGGGIRSVERACALLAAGARRVIVGSSLFDARGVDRTRAARFASAVGADRLVGAIDTRQGLVTVQGWRTAVPISPEAAARDLNAYVGALLYTQVDREGLLAGIDLEGVRTVRRATTARLIAAGGIRHREEVDALDAIGADAVVGMAIYTGVMAI
jgi:phosphoribosylformimino-5-aminoimidazole carboxamide ribotide isomerase